MASSTRTLADSLANVTYRHLFVGLLQNANLLAAAYTQANDRDNAVDWLSLEHDLRGLFAQFEHLANDK